eukprot:gene20311-biopygen1037
MVRSVKSAGGRFVALERGPVCVRDRVGRDDGGRDPRGNRTLARAWRGHVLFPQAWPWCVGVARNRSALGGRQRVHQRHVHARPSPPRRREGAAQSGAIPQGETAADARPCQKRRRPQWPAPKPAGRPELSNRAREGKGRVGAEFTAPAPRPAPPRPPSAPPPPHSAKGRATLLVAALVSPGSHSGESYYVPQVRLLGGRCLTFSHLRPQRAGEFWTLLYCLLRQRDLILLTKPAFCAAGSCFPPCRPAASGPVRDPLLSSQSPSGREQASSGGRALLPKGRCHPGTHPSAGVTGRELGTSSRRGSRNRTTETIRNPG